MTDMWTHEAVGNLVADLTAENDRLRAALERHHRPYAPLTRPCDICGVDPTEALDVRGETSNAGRPHPCSCPPEVVRWLQLAVDYVKAGGGSGDEIRGAVDVKTFLEQPWEGWCAYVSAESWRGTTP